MKEPQTRRPPTVRAAVLLLAAGFALLSTGCEGVAPLTDDAVPEAGDAVLDVVPLLGFASPSGLGNMVPRSVIPESSSYQEITYLMIAPIITGFTPNIGGKGHGDTISFPFLDTTIDLAITRSAGTFTFDGTFANGKGWLRMTYTPSTKLFSYEHIAYVFDEHNTRGMFSDPGEGDPEPRYIEFVIYSVIDSVEVQPNGPFHGRFSAYVDFVMRDGEGGFVFEGHQAGVDAEIYHGPMTLPGVAEFTGTGIAAYLTYGGSEGDRPEGVTGSPSIDNVDAMRDALVELDSPVKNPLLTIWDQDADAFYDYYSNHDLFGISDQGDLGVLFEGVFTTEDREFFIGLLPTGGWQENSLQPPLP